MNTARRSVALTFALASLLLASAGAAHADDIAWKAAHDTDPHLPLTADQLEMSAEKRAAEIQFAGGLPAPEPGGSTADGVTSPSPWMTCGNSCGGGGFPSSASLPGTQTPHATSYYCGPASVHEALAAVGVSLSQAAAANALNTTTNGTAWSGGGTSPSGYPVPDVLNAHQSRNYYIPQPVSSPVPPGAVATYKNDLEMDIYGIQAPLVGDAWEVVNGPHLVGHPNQTIFHWFEIRGYQNNGASTKYEDSVHGAGSISWSPNVPAYSTMSSSTIVTIISGRGYIW